MPARNEPSQLERRDRRAARIACQESLCGLVRSAAFVLSWLILALSLRPRRRPRPNWPQFRGTARLTGVATAAPPATLALKWTYEAGESVESSAAIVDGAVYVGSTKGELLALDLETGKLRWKYATGPNGFIGESSPAVADGAVFVGDLAGTVHAVSAARRQAALDVHDRRRGEVVAGDRRRPRADRIVRHASLRARSPDRQAAVEAADRRAGPRDAGGAERHRLHRRAATSASARCASPTAR